MEDQEQDYTEDELLTKLKLSREKAIILQKEGLYVNLIDYLTREYEKKLRAKLDTMVDNRLGRILTPSFSFKESEGLLEKFKKFLDENSL